MPDNRPNPFPLIPNLGYPVTVRDYSLDAMVRQAWGSEFSAPDHGVYVFGGGARRFDSTDRGETGIYRRS